MIPTLTGEEQILLAGKESIDIGLRDVGALCDSSGGRSVISPFGELSLGGNEYRRPSMISVREVTVIFRRHSFYSLAAMAR
jgi:hypothetical protein